MAPKRSLKQLMDEGNFTVRSLADESGLHENTVRRAVKSSDQARLNTTSATAIAGVFGKSVGEINWHSDLANKGRPAGSGGRYTRRSD